MSRFKIQPTRLVGGFYEVCTSEDCHHWSVYEVDDKGLSTWQADCDTKGVAEILVAALLRSRVDDRCKLCKYWDKLFWRKAVDLGECHLNLQTSPDHDEAFVREEGMDEQQQFLTGPEFFCKHFDAR